MNFVLETITPAKARKYLELNVHNRPVRRYWVARLAKIILDGHWEVTHQGIAFDTKGNLRDGQHRLMAIVEANKAVKIWVAYNESENANLAVDQQAIRNVGDISGSLTGRDRPLNAQEVAVARQMIRSVRKGSGEWWMTNQMVLRFAIAHRDAIVFALTYVNKKEVRHSCIRAVVARAWYTADQERLLQFCEALSSGIAASAADSAAVKLRTRFVDSKRSFHSTGGRVDLYRKAEMALRAFLARKPVAQISPVEFEQFPIPGDEDDTDESAPRLPLVPRYDAPGIQQSERRHGEAWAARSHNHS